MDHDDATNPRASEAQVNRSNSNDRTRARSDSDAAGSPSSRSNSSRSSARQQRVVELLHDVTATNSADQQQDWAIRSDFYDIDVAENDGSQASTSSGSSSSSVYEQFRNPYQENDANRLEDRRIILDNYMCVLHAGMRRRLQRPNSEQPEENNQVGDQADDDIEPDFDAESSSSFNADDSDPDNDPFPDFVIEPNIDNQPYSSDTDDESEQAANYDTSLPISHRYLGENLEESRGRQVLIENTTTILPLINLNDIVLLPGQTLPIKTSNLNLRIQSYLKSCIDRSNTLGILSDSQNNSIGTTAEIRNYFIQEDEARLIIEGRQRFQLMSSPFSIASEGVVKILPEVILGRPYPSISRPMKRLYGSVSTPKKYIIAKHPHWVLRSYEARNMMIRIQEQIKNWCPGGLTSDPTDFSYWVASNLPITNELRIKALSFSCTESRLSWLLSMLERCEAFLCAYCENVICHKEEIFVMSRSGPLCSFVNAGGYIHDTLTVKRATGLIQEYSWSQEYSWFPGYYWRIAHCDNCNRHIGWSYKSIQPDTVPRRFYGISRANVLLQIH